MSYYDPNFPFGYTPYYQQKQNQTNTYAFVNGIEGAKSFPVMSNQSMLLMDSTQSVCYLKSVNALGQMSLKCFKLIETNENDIKATQEQKVAQNVEYATKKDIEQILEKLNKLETKKKE